ncbi:MAG: hypothetical protein ACJAQ4_000615 [Cryomorphaceae bacterium]
MKNALLGPLRFLGNTNLFISLGSLSSVLGAAAFIGAELDYSLACFAFFAALFTYNFQRRIGDLKQDQSYSKTGSMMMIFGVIGMGYFVFKLANYQLVLMGFAGFISLAYAYPFIPSARGKISLRLVPGMKLWTIVLVWTLSCVILPILGSEIDTRVLVLFILQQALFVTALTIPFDIRDLPVDWPEQRTIPQVFGVSKARNLALVFLLFSAVASLSLFLLKEIELNLILIHMGVLLLSGGLISKVKTKRGELYFSIGIDGMLILQGVAFFLAK